jgi:hypothetical protein
MVATVIVSFTAAKGIGSINAPGIGAVRARTDITMPAGGTTGTASLDGEVAVIANGGTVIVAAAFGTTPDGTATAATAATSAGFGVPPNTTVTVPVPAGVKINIAPVA